MLEMAKKLSRIPPRMQGLAEVELPNPANDGCSEGATQVSCRLRRQAGLRRVFVQTELGDVLGLDVDRGERAHSVKKKVQAALCVPTEHCELSFGDLVLEDDLSEVRNDSALLLTRGIPRISSSPCIASVLEALSLKDRNQPIEVVGGYRNCPLAKKLIRECTRAIEGGVEPSLASGGLGGAYYFKDRRGERAAIVKPTDEESFAPNNPKGFIGRLLGEPGFQRSVRVGESGIREVAAYLLDGGFANVPLTLLVKATHHIFNVNGRTNCKSAFSKQWPVAKIASLQQFVRHNYDASEHGMSLFPVSGVHRIGILDIRLYNTDRHAGNILVTKVPSGETHPSGFHMKELVKLTPIDHGLCLPETFEDPYLEWLHWPQASIPFSDEELGFIRALDVGKDVEMLRLELPMLREACLRMLVVSTMFLQEAAEAGLCLAEIGSMMSRNACGGLDEQFSELEILCIQAKADLEAELLELPRNAEGSSTQISYCGGRGSSEDEEDDKEPASLQFMLSMEDQTNGFLYGGAYSPRDLWRPQSLLNCSSRKLCQLSSPSPSPSPSPLPSPNGRSKLPTLLEIPILVENEDLYVMRRPSSSAVGLSPRNLGRRTSSPAGENYAARFDFRGIASLAPPRRSPAGDGKEELSLAEMNDREWALFIELVKSLLRSVFDERKARSLNTGPRLGTSCRF